MSALFTILAVLALIGSVLITLVVLLQNSKGGGLASNFTAGNQTFGVRQTTDILEKITWGLAIFILVISIVTSLVPAPDEKGSDLVDRAGQDVKKTEELVEEGAIPPFSEELAGEQATATEPVETPAE